MLAEWSPGLFICFVLFCFMSTVISVLSLVVFPNFFLGDVFSCRLLKLERLSLLFSLSFAFVFYFLLVSLISVLLRCLFFLFLLFVLSLLLFAVSLFSFLLSSFLFFFFLGPLCFAVESRW